VLAPGDYDDGEISGMIGKRSRSTPRKPDHHYHHCHQQQQVITIMYKPVKHKDIPVTGRGGS
jgi:hypothetical protein